MTKDQWADVQELADSEDGLSEWEMQFASDLFARGPDYELSDKQAAVLRRILEKR